MSPKFGILSFKILKNYQNYNYLNMYILIYFKLIPKPLISKVFNFSCTFCSTGCVDNSPENWKENVFIKLKYKFFWLKNW